MSTKRTAPTLAASFEALLPRDERIQKRTLFGNPCGFVNGTMFTSVHESHWIVRLPDASRARLLGVEGAAIFEPLKGRPMPEYVRVPPTMAANRRRLRGWIKRAFDYCAGLPPPTPGRPRR